MHAACGFPAGLQIEKKIIFPQVSEDICSRAAVIGHFSNYLK